MGKTPEEAHSAYFDKLPAHLFREIEFIRRSTGVGLVTWERIVKIAHDTVAMGTEDIVMVDAAASKPNRAPAQPR